MGISNKDVINYFPIMEMRYIFGKDAFVHLYQQLKAAKPNFDLNVGLIEAFIASCQFTC